MIAKFFKIILVLFTLVVVVAVKLFGWMFRRTRDMSQEAYDSVKNSDSFSEAYRNYTSDKYAKSRLSLPEEVIALMAKIASSDGKISELEIEYMSDTVKAMVSGMQKAGVPESMVARTKQKLFKLANEAKKDDKPIQFYTETLCKSALEVRTGVFMQLVAFASLDGITENTLTTLHHIGETLSFSASEIEQIIERVRGGLGANGGYDINKDPYQELGCQPDDDFALVKKRYRQLVKQHHPDYLHGQGSDEASIQAATEKMQQINTAYEEIKRRLGIK